MVQLSAASQDGSRLLVEVVAALHVNGSGVDAGNDAVFQWILNQIMQKLKLFYHYHSENSRFSELCESWHLY